MASAIAAAAREAKHASKFSLVHTYLSSHRLTPRGKPQPHSEEVGKDGKRGPNRPCPQVLNDWTLA
eukprot:2441374-Pleurochrysis_carterae.AAC.1